MSIRDHGFRVMELRSLVVDMEDIRARAQKPDVIELAKSRKNIALHPITVDAANKQLRAGRDRFAADFIINKVQRAAVRLVEGTPDEMQDIEDEENLRRRHENRDELIAAYIARKSAGRQVTQCAITGQMPGNSPRKRGRPKTAEGEVREELAAKLDVAPDTIRKAEARAKSSPQSKGSGEAAAPASGAPPPIALKGTSQTAEYLAKVREVQAAIDAADKAGRAMQAALAKVADLPFPRSVLQRLQGRAHQLAADIRAFRPRSACVADHSGHCTLCGGAGWLGEDADTIQEDSGPTTPVTTSTGNQRAQPRPAPSSVNRGAAAGASNGTRRGAGSGRADQAPTDAAKHTTAKPAPKKVQILDENDKPIDVHKHTFHTKNEAGIIVCGICDTPRDANPVAEEEDDVEF